MFFLIESRFQWPKVIRFFHLSLTVAVVFFSLVLDHFFCYLFRLFFYISVSHSFPSKRYCSSDWNTYCILFWNVMCSCTFRWKRDKHTHTQRETISKRIESQYSWQCAYVFYIDRFLPIILWFLWNKKK